MSLLLNVAIQGIAAIAAKGVETLIMADDKPSTRKPTVIKTKPVVKSELPVDERKEFKEMFWQSRENDSKARQNKWKKGRPDPVAAMRWRMGEMEDRMKKLETENASLSNGLSRDLDELRDQVRYLEKGN